MVLEIYLPVLSLASLIGNNISVTEATRRIDAAVKRVKNADPAVLTTLKELFIHKYY
jgi:hypothetical protein